MLALMLAAAAASFTADKAQLLCGTEGQQAATWSGACKDGLADGAGVATWFDATTPNKLEGTLTRGEVSGDAKVMFGSTSYQGTLRHFVPHGQGFFKFRDGSMYEGGVDHDYFSGPGIFQAADRSRYEGMWVEGRREGQGQATFALGGSYEGHWHNNRFDGYGAIVYVGGRTYKGQFKEGRRADLPAPAVIEQHQYSISNMAVTVGSYDPFDLATSNVPGAAWAKLTDNERRLVTNQYAALEDGDEPPYPIDGTRPVIAVMARVGYVDQDFHGTINVHVLVGVDGKPKFAAAIGKMPPDVARYAAGVMMVTSYKPARCHGQPCEMLYPFAIDYGSAQ